MTTPHESHETVAALSRALDQTGDLMATVRADQLSLPTPCEDWTVEQLLRHLIADTANFMTMMRGEEPDWSADPAPLPEDWAAAFRAGADDLIHLWHQREGEGDGPPVDMQTGEFAVHAWDLARAIDSSTELDPEVAERGLAFMSAALKPEMRGEAFAAEVSVPDDASVYERLAAFAGRNPAA
jgi:uncharacterized protein (TIGR03086 family)